jgi:hypothetical protein
VADVPSGPRLDFTSHYAKCYLLGVVIVQLNIFMGHLFRISCRFVQYHPLPVLKIRNMKHQHTCYCGPRAAREPLIGHSFFSKLIHGLYYVDLKNSSVCIVTRLRGRSRSRGSIPGRGKIILLSITFRPALEPIQPPV